MNKTIGFVFLTAGIILLVYGLSAIDSVSSSFSRIFNGAPSNKSIMLLFSGAILTAWGGFTVFRSGTR